MTEETQTPVVATPPVVPAADATPVAPAARPVGPADDIREIQMLLVRGQFPGEVAPMVVKGFQFLDKLASEIEKAKSATVGK